MNETSKCGILQNDKKSLHKNLVHLNDIQVCHQRLSRAFDGKLGHYSILV